MEFSSIVALIASIIAVTTATFCPVFSVILANQGAKRLRKSEAIFQEKTIAFSNFLKISDALSDLNNQEQVTMFSNAFSMALLFSSKETAALLEEYKIACIQSLATKSKNPHHQAFKKAAKIKNELIMSMQKDLNSW